MTGSVSGPRIVLEMRSARPATCPRSWVVAASGRGRGLTGLTPSTDEMGRGGKKSIIQRESQPKAMQLIWNEGRKGEGGRVQALAIQGRKVSGSLTCLWREGSLCVTACYKRKRVVGQLRWDHDDVALHQSPVADPCFAQHAFLFCDGD